MGPSGGALCGDLGVLGQNLLAVVGLAVQLAFTLLVVVLLEGHLADGTLEAHLVEDPSSRLHALGGIHRLAACVTLLGYGGLERHLARNFQLGE